MLVFILAFDLVAAFFDDVLWQHAEMSAERYACSGDGAHLLDNFTSALGLHRFCPGGDEALCVLDGERNSFVAAERHVAHYERLRLGAGDGADVMLHVR